MTISEAEEYVSENYEEITEFILEDEDDHAIILYSPGYEIPDYNIVCYEGYWYDKAEDQADFALTAVYEDDEYIYWEQDNVSVTLYNYLRQTGRSGDVYSINCNIKERKENE